MKIFITGGSGFIGSYVVDLLLEKGHEIICLVHNKEINKTGVTSIKGDILDKNSLRAMEGCDAVIHSAAIYEFGPIKKIRKVMYDINVQGTKNTIDLALEYGIPKIVYVSTVGIFGNTTKVGLAKESDIEQSEEVDVLYIHSKQDAHNYVQKLIDERNAPITIAMPGAVFGKEDHSVLGELLEQLVTGKLLGLIDSDSRLNYVHVEDVAMGIVLCLEKGKNEPYIINGPPKNNLTAKDFTIKAAELGGLELPKNRFSVNMTEKIEIFYRLMGKITGKHQFINKELIQTFYGTIETTNEKAVKELGFNPRPLDERIQQTIDWYKQTYQ